ITVVSPSKWLADCAGNSAIFASKTVRVIRTGVELDVFTPTERQDARRRLGLDENKITLLFGANSASDERKGFHLLQDALEAVRTMGFVDTDIQVLITGLAGDSPGISFPYHYL